MRSTISRRRVGTVSRVTSAVANGAILGLDDDQIAHVLESDTEYDEDGGEEYMSDDNLLEPSDGDQRSELFSVPANVLPYPKDHTVRDENQVPSVELGDTLMISACSNSELYRKNLSSLAHSTENSEEHQRIMSIYEELELDQASGTKVDRWSRFRAALITKIVSAVFGHSRKTYGEETIHNALTLFDRIIAVEAHSLRADRGYLSPYRLTALPPYAKVGLAREEITTLAAACLHVSSKLANIRHIPSRVLCAELQCSERAIHVYEMLILQHRKCDILLLTPINYVQELSPFDHRRGHQNNVHNVLCRLILLTLSPNWRLYYARSFAQLSEHVMTIADRLIKEARTELKPNHLPAVEVMELLSRDRKERRGELDRAFYGRLLEAFYEALKDPIPYKSDGAVPVPTLPSMLVLDHFKSERLGPFHLIQWLVRQAQLMNSF